MAVVRSVNIYTRMSVNTLQQIFWNCWCV